VEAHRGFHLEVTNYPFNSATGLPSNSCLESCKLAGFSWMASLEPSSCGPCGLPGIEIVESLAPGPEFLPFQRRRRKNHANDAITARLPRATPTPTPAFPPFESPDEPLVEGRCADVEVGVEVEVDEELAELEVTV
jgi:hypothetical protein